MRRIGTERTLQGRPARRPDPSHRILAGLAVCAVLLAGRVAAADVPPNFVVENVAPGATFNVPTGIAYLPGGRLLVAEKRGRVYFVTNGVKSATPLWSRENEVLNETDRGLLDVAVHPDYVNNHYVYFLYTVDPDSNGVDTNNNGFGRLARYQVSFADSTQLIASSRTILMGTDWPNGPLSDSPSHTIGSLRWGADGSLLVSIGDGADYDEMDAGGLDPTAYGAGKTDPAEDIGAFRAQWLDCLPGKVLRINPLTGRGYASNPYVQGSLSSIRSRVYAYGIRNTFRFTVRPGTGSPDTSLGNPGVLYLGDVGWTQFEEMNIARTPGINFGWPCYEGFTALTAYQEAEPDHNGCDSFGSPSNPATATSPVQAWHHYNASLSTPYPFEGNASVGGVFYTGALYPAGYQNRYFFADYGGNWIKVAVMNGFDELQQIISFGDDMDGPVDLILEPGTGNIVYTSIFTGEIRRIRYTGPTGNQVPIAQAGASPNAGEPPLLVQFSSAGSLDLDGDPITYEWVFGDGQGSTDPNPSHTYTIAGGYQAILTVRDDQGGQASDTLQISVVVTEAFPLTPVLDTFNRADGPIGSNWIGTTGALSITGNRLASSGGTMHPVWNPVIFGPNQEAYVTIAVTSPTSPGQDVLLKLQGSNPADVDPHLEVRYDATQSRVMVSTFHPVDGWVTYLTIPSITFTAGQRLGARAFANGTVQVFRNTTLIGTTSIAAWPYAGSLGRIGMTLDLASGARWDDFGGGTFQLNPNTAPTANLLAPANGGFFVHGDQVPLTGTGTDGQQSSETLEYHWQVDLRHNNHVHPEVFAADGPVASLPTQNHDDGTGTWYEIHLRVTDAAGLADTATVSIYPEVDLEPSASTNTPGLAGTTTPTTFNFWLHNHGRMPSRISRWRIVAGTTTLAEGDTVVAALDSVYVTAVAAPQLAPGDYPLRVTVDTLAVVVETNETNNASVKTLTVVAGAGTVGTDAGLTPRAIALSGARPSPSRDMVTFALELPAPASVGLSVHDLLGRRVWSQPVRAYGPGRWTLAWDGRGESGAPAPGGIYHARVTVDGRVLVRTIARLR